jgi:hypothetical protein
MKNHEPRTGDAPAGSRPTGPTGTTGPTGPTRPTRVVATPPDRTPRPKSRDERERELDLAIDEIAPTTHLKEGFTGQER